MNSHKARGTLHFYALPSQLVERLAITLYGRIHGWHLLNSASQRRHRLSHSAFIDGAGIGSCRNFTLHVQGVGTNAQYESAGIGLVGIQHKL